MKRFLKVVGIGLGILMSVAALGVGSGFLAWQAFLADGRHLRIGTPFQYFVNGVPHSLAFSPDGRKLAVLGDGSWWRLVETESGASTNVNTGQTGDLTLDAASLLAWSPDGRMLAIGQNPSEIEPAKRKDEKLGVIILWDVVVGKEARRLDLGWDHVDSLAFDPSGRHLAITRNAWDDERDELVDGRISFFSVESGQEVETVRRQGQPIYSLSFAADRLVFASRRDDPNTGGHTAGEIVVRGAGDAEKAFAPPPGPPLKAVLPGPSGTILAVTYEGSPRVSLVDVEGRLLRELDADAPDAPSYGRGAFTPDGRHFIHGSARPAGAAIFHRWARSVRIFDVATGTLRAVLPVRSTEENAVVDAVAVSPDGRLAAAGYGTPWLGQPALWRLDEVLR